MSKSFKPEPYLAVDFGEQGGHFEWMSHNEVIAWLTQLNNDWHWISQYTFTPTLHAWQAISDALSSATVSIQNAQVYLNKGQIQDASAQLKAAATSLEDFIRAQPWLLENNANRQFVEHLRDNGMPIEAALIVSHWLGLDLSDAPVQATVSALLQWELYERGIKDRMKTENAVLKKLAGDMQNSLTRNLEAERRQLASFEELRDQIENQSAEQHMTFTSDQQTREESWAKQLVDTQDELIRLKDTYDKYMALAAPVEYWDSKRKKHGKLTVVSFVMIMLSMVATAFFLNSELQTVGDAVLANRSNVGTAMSSSPDVTVQSMAVTATAWHIGTLLLLASLSFWFIRLLVRIFFSNMHLENDAAERVTMVKTYLALIRNHDLPAGGNINTVLTALFRQTGDGIIKDEGVPPSTLEWFTKLGR
jgi:Family of unknown function (DUF6161)